MAILHLSGISDEAGADIDTQIRAHRELGWRYLDLRLVEGENITSISEAMFEHICDAVGAAGMQVACFASGICSWGRSVRDDFALDVAELRRAIPRMQRLGTRLIRVMSCPGSADIPDEEFGREAVRRLRTLSHMAEDAGIVLVHENVGNGWTGESPERMLQLVGAVDSPAFRLLFDMANFDGPDAGEQSWRAYQRLKGLVVHVHLKDRRPDGANTWFGEGTISTRRILQALYADGFQGVLAMEPHIASVHHTGTRAAPEVMYQTYLENGRRINEFVRALGAGNAKGDMGHDTASH